MPQPTYFGRIREIASTMWDLLEDDPRIAGPWRQLFIQVQIPRHVVSELLQNADDCGATAAAVDIKDGVFTFSHNGEDFTEEQFGSLCGFGFSNKRTLRTIGFRGVGFKSTFSLGGEVFLTTPTLSVAFQKNRFTEPIWVQPTEPIVNHTEVRVNISSEGSKEELIKNLQEWKTNPASLLFFTNIRRLRVQDQEIQWESKGPGPIEGSEWMSTSSESEKHFLLIRSKEHEFPADALREVREQRRADADDDLNPLCRVEIVVGMEGRMYVVLPTGVKTQLPFACNAPFIQDPARMTIKDPAVSPTNSWLLKRAGELAAEAMLAWVGQEDLSIDTRCQAYELLPNVNRYDHSLEGGCATLVERAFEARCGEQAFLLTESDSLATSGQCLSVPGELFDVWSPEQLSEELSMQALPLLCKHVSEQDTVKLANLRHIRWVDKSRILDVLKNKGLPRPASWQQMLYLWSYVSSDVDTPWSLNRGVRIMPVQGQPRLHAAGDVVRIGERSTLNPSDWEFLAPYLSVIDQNWIRFLAGRQPTEESHENDELRHYLDRARGLLRILGHVESTEGGRVFRKVSDAFFVRGTKRLSDFVRLAHIAAKLGVPVPDSFRYVTQEGRIRDVKRTRIVADVDGDLDLFVGNDWYQSNVLHEAYAKPSSTCTPTEWHQWVQSPASRLNTFVSISKTQSRLVGKDNLRKLLQKQGFDGEPYFHYKYSNFRVEDWDFTESHWAHWKAIADDDCQFWANFMTRILSQPLQYWSEAKSARALQVATTGNTRSVTSAPLTSAWILKLRDLPCLFDTQGRPRFPYDLLVRTPETEPLLGVEPFVKPEFDTEANRELLRLLGVREEPTGPKHLLDRLRALARSEVALVPEVQKWCHSLDQIFDRSSTADIREIRTAFSKEKLILTDRGDWAGPTEVFLNKDEEGIKGSALIHPSISELSIWRKLGVSERPTPELAISWLNGLPPGGRLTPSDAERVRQFQSSYPVRIWEECRHWLSLAGEWAPVESLAYSVTMQSLVQWNHLFPGVTSKVADFRRLSSGVSQGYPFSGLPRLGNVIEERFQGQSNLADSQKKEWLLTLGTELSRIVLEDTDQTERVRKLGRRLAQTSWQASGTLESVPYIGGMPVGASRPMDAIWHDDCLYVRRGSPAKLAKVVPHEISRSFDRDDIADAVKLCYERPAPFIREYLEESFELAPTRRNNCVQVQQPEDIDCEANHAGEDNLEAFSADGIDSENESPAGDEPMDDDNYESSDSGNSTGGMRHQPGKSRQRRHRPSVLERFAVSRGFTKGSSDDVFQLNGHRIEKTNSGSFPWRLVSPDGAIMQYYWWKDHCIQQEPLALEADIWSLFQGAPDLHSLILTGLDEKPILIPGIELMRMMERDELILYPASYRLVYQGRDSESL